MAVFTCFKESMLRLPGEPNFNLLSFVFAAQLGRREQCVYLHRTAGALTCCGHCCPTHIYSRHQENLCMSDAVRTHMQPDLITFVVLCTICIFFKCLITQFSHNWITTRVAILFLWFVSVNLAIFILFMSLPNEQPCRPLRDPKGQHKYTKQAYY